MSHLPDVALRVWKTREPLAAADLNRNFALLLSLIESVMGAALTPDPVAVNNEVGIDVLDRRVAALERLAMMHARQRNEREYATLAHVGALVTQVNDLRRDLEGACGRLEQACASVSAMHDDQARRLARLEQQPEAATKEEHDALASDHQRIAEKEHMLLNQVISLRAETMHLIKAMMGHRRQRNQMEYAPLAHVGAVIHMVKELQAKLASRGIL